MATIWFYKMASVTVSDC